MKFKRNEERQVLYEFLQDSEFSAIYTPHGLINDRDLTCYLPNPSVGWTWGSEYVHPYPNEVADLRC